MDRDRALQVQQTHVVVIGASRFDRDCTAVELSRARGIRAEACEEPSAYRGPASPDVIVLQDTHGQSGVAWLPAQLASISTHWSGASIVVIGAQPSTIGPCLNAHVQAHLPSETTPDQVVSAIRMAQAGMMIYPSMLIDHIVAAGQRHSVETATYHASDETVSRLTSRQLDVLRSLARGLSNREIARALTISESTVKVHVRAIMKHMRASSRSQVIARFVASHVTACANEYPNTKVEAAEASVF